MIKEGTEDDKPFKNDWVKGLMCFNLPGTPDVCCILCCRCQGATKYNIQRHLARHHKELEIGSWTDAERVHVIYHYKKKLEAHLLKNADLEKPSAYCLLKAMKTIGPAIDSKIKTEIFMN